MAEDYMAWFEMLVGRTGFNNAVLEDIYVAWNEFSEKDILDIIAKAIATALDDREKQKEAKVDVKMDFWLGWWWKTHPTWPIISQSWKIVW